MLQVAPACQSVKSDSMFTARDFHHQAVSFQYMTKYMKVSLIPCKSLDRPVVGFMVVQLYWKGCVVNRNDIFHIADYFHVGPFTLLYRMQVLTQFYV